MPRTLVAPLAPCLAQAPDQLDVERMPGVPRLLAGVDHEFLPDAEARVVLLGKVRRLCESSPSRLQTRTRSSVTIGSLSIASSPGRASRDRVAAADADDHHRHRLVAGEEPRALPAPVRHPVDAEQHRRAGEAALVEVVDDRERTPAGRRLARRGRDRS